MKTINEQASDINELLIKDGILNDYVKQGNCHAWVIKPQHIPSYTMEKLIAIYSYNLKGSKTIHIPESGGIVFSLCDSGIQPTSINNFPENYNKKNVK